MFLGVESHETTQRIGLDCHSEAKYVVVDDKRIFSFI